MNYRFHKGMAFQKKRKGVAKFNINGRVMIDPATFRRINPNYAISIIKPKEDDDDEDSEDEDECGCGQSEDEADDNNPLKMGDEEKEELPKTKFKVVLDAQKKPMVVEVPIDEFGKELALPEKLETISSDPEKGRVFTEEELLIASSVVLGFAFSEKAWLEFSLSGIHEIDWNESAYESLVLPKNQKHVVKALVSSHKFHAAETIDDVVQGKGRGLVFVLHGPPGVGKTLTAEGVAEDLRCPLYAVSMGELGTDSNRLEQMLQQVMDIAHSWGAVLLLDEADVFLEKRQHQDVHRNALVSIFLRLLEYFQGILFLTTNRVETFDEAFQSRIHVALKYEELTPAAQKKVWKEFIEKVRVMQGIEIMPFTDSDYDYLARRRLNGRQIKNAVRTAQALALHEEAKLSMEHIKRVLEVAESFEQDLKGGSGYLDAMRSYT
jgi:DNA polymerase III delta prime subunit